MEGIIIKNESNNYTVRTNKGINICKPRGKFRLDKITPLVGDKVIIDDINNYLLEIKPRKNSLIRPQIANVDPSFPGSARCAWRSGLPRTPARLLLRARA